MEKLNKIRKIGILFIICACLTRYANAETITFQYDQLNRLKKVSDDSHYSTTYTFDAAGNRLTKTVSTKPVFSEDIKPGETAMNAQHIIELADAVDAIRASRGQSGYSWDWSFSPQFGGPILVEYIRKLRIAIEELKGSDITWTDDVMYSYSENPQNATLIKAIHITELQNAISALWQ